jgi:hypothetical protein
MTKTKLVNCRWGCAQIVHKQAKVPQINVSWETLLQEVSHLIWGTSVQSFFMWKVSWLEKNGRIKYLYFRLNYAMLKSEQQESISSTIYARLFRKQFHQHFKSSFCVPKFCAKPFCTYILCLHFFGAKILAHLRDKTFVWKSCAHNVGEIYSMRTKVSEKKWNFKVKKSTNISRFKRKQLQKLKWHLDN